MIFQKALINSFEVNRERRAIENGITTISYSSLFNRSNRVTRFLLDLELEPETMIGIMLPDKTSLIYSIIGVVNARCVFVPLDGTSPDARLSAVINDLNLKFVISSYSAIPADVVIKNPSITNFFIEDIIEQAVDTDQNTIPYPEYHPEDSLYIYFTSGSTGIPKGIVGKNCSLLQFLKWEIETFGLDANIRSSQFISPYFDAFLRDIFTPLLTGGTICIPPAEEDFFSPEKLVPWIDKSAISLIHCVPSLFRIINDDSLTTDNFKALRYVLLSGERMVPSTLRKWYNLFDFRIQLVNLYGTTETTMIRSFYKIQPNDSQLARIPIGIPISDTKLLVVKKDFQVCDTLVSGDLYIASNYTSKGYLNSPELTHDKFLKINAGTAHEILVFKTGDKARKLSTGELDLIGREDRQIKLRGIRIELDEIENVLVQNQFVKNAVVIKYVDKNESESLVAFYIKHNAEQADLTKSIQLYVESLLPKYMVPAELIAVEEFPLLSNGKINYASLSKYLASRTSRIIEAPVNNVEERLLSIWKDILGDKSISTTENFLALGGDSLSLMRVIGKIYKDFSVRIPLNQLFNNLTIRSQSELISSLKTDSTLTIIKSDEKAAYNVSAAQERVYYSYELNKSSIAFNVPMAWKIVGEFNKVKIESVLKSLLMRHEILRTSFTFENGKVMQVVNEVVHFQVEEIDGERQTVTAAISSFIRAFDLSKAPLIRCAIITVNDSERILITDMHHIITDGMSQVNLLSDFQALYRNETLKPLPIQFKDYAEWECAYKKTAFYLAHREFWLNAFEGQIQKLDLPFTNADDRSGSGDAEKINFRITEEICSPILDALREREITSFSGLFTIFAMYLSQLTGQNDFIVGINSSGRMQNELEDVVGMFAKTLPIRCQVDTNKPFRKLAKEIHDHLIKANSHQCFDLTDIVDVLDQKTAGRNLFDVMFVFLNFEHKAAKTDDDFLPYELESTSAKHPMILYAIQQGSTISFKLEYSTTHFARADITLLVTQFTSLINAVSENLDAKINEYVECI